MIDTRGELHQAVMRAVVASEIKDVPIVPIGLTNKDYVVSYNLLLMIRRFETW